MAAVDDHEFIAQRFRLRARELGSGDLAWRLKVLSGDGLVNLVSREPELKLASAALRAVAEEDAVLAQAAAYHLLAADLVYRWARCDNLKVLEGLFKGQVLAALSGPGEFFLEGDRLRGCAPEVPLAPLAEVIIVVAGRGPAVTALTLSREEAGMTWSAPHDQGQGLPAAELSFSSLLITRQHIIGSDPLPPSEPEALPARRQHLFESLMPL
jgi:hypothetical protein